MAKVSKSKYCNDIPKDHVVQSRNLVPSDYHCTCDYCKNFMGEIFNNDEGKHYSNRIRKHYYKDGAGDHLDAGHLIGYRWAIQNLSPKGGIVLDPTVGTGTAIVEAINNGRDAIGIELEYPDVTQKNIDAQKESDEEVAKRKVWFRQGNATKIDEYLDEWEIQKGDVDLIINGTPYPKLSGKSSDAPERKNLKTGEDKSFDYYHEENIGITKGDEYWGLVKTMYSKSIEYLKPGGYFVILIKDMVQNKTPYLLHKHIIDVVLDANPDMESYGFFVHSHAPTTMFQNTYGKRFPEVPIPWYQVGIVLRKKGSKEPGFPIPANSMDIRPVPYKLHDMDSLINVNYRKEPGKVLWEDLEGNQCKAPDMKAKTKKTKIHAKPEDEPGDPNGPKGDLTKESKIGSIPQKDLIVEHEVLEEQIVIPLPTKTLVAVDLSNLDEAAPETMPLLDLTREDLEMGVDGPNSDTVKYEFDVEKEFSPELETDMICRQAGSTESQAENLAHQNGKNLGFQIGFNKGEYEGFEKGYQQAIVDLISDSTIQLEIRRSNKLNSKKKN